VNLQRRHRPRFTWNNNVTIKVCAVRNADHNCTCKLQRRISRCAAAAGDARRLAWDAQLANWIKRRGPVASPARLPRTRARSITARYSAGQYRIDHVCEDGISDFCKSRDNVKHRPAFQQWDTVKWPSKKKKDLSEWTRCQQATGRIYFTDTWRVTTFQPGLGYNDFKCIFKCISWLKAG
jgi:hypothetical protein